MGDSQSEAYWSNQATDKGYRFLGTDTDVCPDQGGLYSGVINGVKVGGWLDMTERTKLDQSHTNHKAQKGRFLSSSSTVPLHYLKHHR